MLKIALLATLLALSGCVAAERVADQIPTARYCSDVDYSRHNNEVNITAKCTAPFGGL